MVITVVLYVDTLLNIHQVTQLFNVVYDTVHNNRVLITDLYATDLIRSCNPDFLTVLRSDVRLFALNYTRHLESHVYPC